MLNNKAIKLKSLNYNYYNNKISKHKSLLYQTLNHYNTNVKRVSTIKTKSDDRFDFRVVNTTINHANSCLTKFYSSSITKQQEFHLNNTSDLTRKSLYLGKTGGQIFYQKMVEKKVNKIFGYPGGAILPVFDAIYNKKSEFFELIMPRHEQSAGHMAEGYSRACNKPGVVLVTSGPGCTNVMTAIQDAFLDGVPLVVFSGQVPTNLIGTDAFQEADVVGMSRNCTKWNCLVKNIEELPYCIDEAFEVAMSGRKGPVLVDLPKDITASTLLNNIDNSGILTRYINLNKPYMNKKLIRKNIIESAQMINDAKSPIIYAGRGILDFEKGPELLRELSHKADIPVTTTLMGLGAFDELDKNSLHMLGMHGSAYANLGIQAADVIIALGARFDDRVTGDISKFAYNTKLGHARKKKGGIIHFEILPKNINKCVNSTIAVIGDLRENLQTLIDYVQPQERNQWINLVNKWKNKYPFKNQRNDNNEILKPQCILDELDQQTKHIKDNIIITTGVGQHQMFAAQYIRWIHPHSFITSGGLGTMGFGLPAAIGAKIAQPKKVVIDIDGDASFSMTAMELMTASQNNIKVKVLILNNNFQGMVKQWQDLFYEKRHSSTKMTNPDFIQLARAMNCMAIKLENKSELKSKMKQFLEYDSGPIVMEAVIDKDEHVYPMVPAGKGLHEMLIGKNKTIETEDLDHIFEPTAETKY